ncbi:MAG: hypothetical protein CVU71_03640 [Deltaproteobacteria bacterium HGW-Deltaproteobacteria-6]|jgi:hypothetical protein|nr:MAG: hypothetical protein CVU71_03640 [Deltaproteobacteria bacterium HGW-Deltaproteobacteria-6]
MIVDLERKPTESGSFELKGGGKVHLRLMDSEDIRELQKACMTSVPEYPLLKNPETGKDEYRRFDAPKFDGDLWDEMMWDRVITGWDDLFDKDKKPIPCTKENKVLLMTCGKAKEFVDAVNNGLKTLKDQDKARSEATEKN